MVYVNHLQRIEAILGCIENWPSKIIKLIFIVDYNRKNIFQVIYFFYGNKVPVNVALPFYSMCNDHNRFLALCHFTLLYNMWDMNMHTTCTCAFCGYYDMNHKKYMSIRKRAQ